MPTLTYLVMHHPTFTEPWSVITICVMFVITIASFIYTLVYAIKNVKQQVRALEKLRTGRLSRNK